jgi:predicted RND superfamily exporter protein
VRAFRSAAAPSILTRRYGQWVGAADRHPRRLALAVAVALLPALLLTVRFFSDVRAGLEELLPRSATSVKALEELHRRLGGQSHLTVIAASGDVAANRQLIDRFCQRMAARHLPEVRSLQCRVDAERRWLTDHALLLMPAERFGPLVDEVDRALAQARTRANPLYLDLDESAEGGRIWDPLEQRLDEEQKAHDRFPAGYLELPDGSLVVAIVWLQGSEVDMAPAERLMAAARADVAAVRGGANVQVAYNGEVPNLIEEHDAILADLSLSSALVFLLVGALILGYFRSTRALGAVLAGLVPGLLVTFALGSLTVGHLNSNTAFLGSIIAGNGINYPLLFLAYYRRRPPDQPRAGAIMDAARGSFWGTLGAAATASAAYGGLAASSFKGFSQFGWLGGAGMVSIWLLSLIAMPVAIAVFDPPRRDPRSPSVSRALERFFTASHGPLVLSALFLAATVLLAAIGAARAVQGGLYDMDLQSLRNRDSLAHGSASWDRRMNDVFGVWLNPVAGLVDDPAHLESLAGELRRVLVDGASAPAERVETIHQYAPVDQEARLVRLTRLRSRLEDVPPEQIPEKVRPFIERWLAPENLRVITPAEVPAALAQGFAELSGRRDRTALLYPSLKVDYNDGRNILAFADRLGRAALPPDAVVGGGFLFMAEIIRRVRDEAPRVMVTVYLLVTLVLIPIFLGKPARILLVSTSVAMVAIAAQSIMLAAGVRLNMLNFAAVPITIGVGADYLVNLLGAMDALGLDARRACAQMGGAILLCSLTTVVGYSSLLLARSGVLRSFGWAAVLGEVMAVAAVLLVLPALSGRGPRTINGFHHA